MMRDPLTERLRSLGLSHRNLICPSLETTWKLRRLFLEDQVGIPENAVECLYFGYYHQIREEGKLADQALKKGFKEHCSIECLTVLGKYWSARQPERAIKYYLKGVSAGHSFFLNSIGLVYKNQGNPLAIEYFRQARRAEKAKGHYPEEYYTMTWNLAEYYRTVEGNFERMWHYLFKLVLPSGDHSPILSIIRAYCHATMDPQGLVFATQQADSELIDFYFRQLGPEIPWSQLSGLKVDVLQSFLIFRDLPIPLLTTIPPPYLSPDQLQQKEKLLLKLRKELQSSATYFALSVQDVNKLVFERL